MRATDPIIFYISESFEFFLTFVMVLMVVFFMALPIGMSKIKEEGRGEHVKKKALYSGVLSLVIAAIIFYLTKAD